MVRKTHTEELASLNIQDWVKTLRWLNTGISNLRTTRTRLPSGGNRPWFLCPSCGRRCGILYTIGSRYICRICGGLSYGSQNEPRLFRALRKVQKIRVRLGGSANMTEQFPDRPRYMHRRTYKNLKRQYDAEAEQDEGLIALWLQNPGGPYCD